MLIDILRGLFVDFCIVITASWASTSLTDDFADRRKSPARLVVYSAFTTILGLLLMQFPVRTTDGIMYDLRLVPIVVGTFLAGRAPGTVATLILLAYRIHLGGVGLVPGIISLLTCWAVTLLLAKGPDAFLHSGQVLWRGAVAFGIADLAILAVPGHGFELLKQVWVPMVVFQTSAAALVAGIIRQRMLAVHRERDTVMLAQTDHLTGLYNVRTLEQMLLARRENSHDCLLLLDLDRFKAVNDTYGHVVGDQVLQHCARMMKQSVRTSDEVFRYGGEEFVVLLRNCYMPVAAQVAERIRATVADSPVEVDGHGRLIITISGGLVRMGPDASIKERIVEADRLLYEAKAGGRNRIRLEA